MNHIKYLSLVLVVGIISFYKGMDIGADKMGMHRVAIESLPELRESYTDDKITKKELLQRQVNSNRAKRSEAIITYGIYLDSFSYYAPDFLGLDAHTQLFMKEIIKELLKNNSNYFHDMNEYYDLVIKENDSNAAINKEYNSYKRQLKIVEEKFKP